MLKCICTNVEVIVLFRGCTLSLNNVQFEATQLKGGLSVHDPTLLEHIFLFHKKA